MEFHKDKLSLEKVPVLAQEPFQNFRGMDFCCEKYTLESQQLYAGNTYRSNRNNPL